MNSNQDQGDDETLDLEKIDSEGIKLDDQSIEIEDKYQFGWSS